MEQEDRLRLVHESWCFANNILIYGEAIAGTKLVRIVVNNKGQIKKGEREYKQGNQVKANDEKWWEVVYLLRKNYYDKHHKN